MTWHLSPDTAWAVDQDTGIVHAMVVPDGTPVALEASAAAVFTDIDEGLDPIAEAVQRWPDEEGVEEGTLAFVRTLVQMGLVIENADPTVPRAATPSPTTPTAATPSPTTPSAATLTPAAPQRLAHEPSSEHSVLFVCTGNICRSAYADVRARAAGVPGIAFGSAGTQAMTGYPLDEPMAVALGGDTPDHRARQITREIAEGSALILTMSRSHRNFVLEEWPHLARRTFLLAHAARELPSLPPGGSMDDLLAHLWNRRTRRPDDDVADPYRKGLQAATECARRIDSLLEPVLTALSGLSPDA